MKAGFLRTGVHEPRPSGTKSSGQRAGQSSARSDDVDPQVKDPANSENQRFCSISSGYSFALMKGVVDAVPELVGVVIGERSLKVPQNDFEEDVLLAGSKSQPLQCRRW